MILALTRPRALLRAALDPAACGPRAHSGGWRAGERTAELMSSKAYNVNRDPQ